MERNLAADARRSTAGEDPLAGLRVVDFTIVMSGPMCTRVLADAGADVIKVESPEGDMVRQRPPFHGGISTYFASMNCGKRSVVLDLQTALGRQAAVELAAKADVVVENFRPGVMKRLGLDYETLSRENPRLVYCSISGFGQAGPQAHAPAYAPVIHAASGYEDAFARYQGDTSRPPNNGIFIADVMGAIHAASAIQTALLQRSRTGRGQCIDVSLMDSVLGMLIYELQDAQFPAERQRQVYQPVRANDGWVMVAAITPRNLAALFDVIGFPEGKDDPRFATVAQKEANWGVLLEIIEQWTSQRSAVECEQTLMRAGVPCSRYRTVKEAMSDPQAQARGLMTKIDTAQGPFQVANPPYLMSAGRMQARNRLPRLGQDTEDVLREVLGYGDAQLRQMRDAKVF
ncbi:MAG TPA: CoA transferase [Burkholderiaceae bacterium]|jgi:CoA:oxalate CoA-transferase|nr:CoA transferase [Burkholderiaceae bacterium]